LEKGGEMSEIDWSTASEQEMREAEAPRPKDTAELAALVDTLLKRQHDYGTCCYAMSIAATAAFNLVASTLGVTGFQAGCADMDILRRTRHWKGPAMVLDLANYLYPQYDLPKMVQESIDDNADWFSEQAKELLKTAVGFVHPDVKAHWERLAALKP
jgi:hypothetical protein